MEGTGRKLHMKWLSLRNNQLNFKSLRKLHINQETSIEYTLKKEKKRNNTPIHCTGMNVSPLSKFLTWLTML